MSSSLSESSAGAAGDLILEALGVGVLAVDRQGRVVRFNRQAAQLTEVPAERILGRVCHRVITSSRCRLGCPLRDALSHGRTGRCDLIVLGETARPAVLLDMTAAPLLAPEEGIVGAVATLRRVRDGTTTLRVYGSRVLVCRTESMGRVFDALPMLARSQAPLLVVGEPGSGRATLARTVHLLRQPLAPGGLETIDCSDRPARRVWDRLAPGLGADPRTSTVLLRNLCASRPRLQRDLLASIEEARPGLRLVATATPQLLDLVEEGRFREDLYYRLAVLHVSLPSLSQRPADVPLLADIFLDEANQARGGHVRGFSARALQRLITAPLPGNVRQLEEVVRQAHAACRTSDLIDVEHLPAWVAGSTEPRLAARSHDAQAPAAGRHEIERALEAADGNVSQAARALGIHRTTLWRRLRRLGVQP